MPGGRLIYDSVDAVRWNAGRNSRFEILIPAGALSGGTETVIELLSDEGTRRESFEVGESLAIHLRGLRPISPHSIVVSSSGKELFTSTLISNSRGEIEPTVLWPQIGFDDPLSGEIYSIDEAVEKWRHKTMSVSVRFDKEDFVL